MINTTVGAGAGAASRYAPAPAPTKRGGSLRLRLRLLAAPAPAPQHCCILTTGGVCLCYQPMLAQAEALYNSVIYMYMTPLLPSVFLADLKKNFFFKRPNL
jgi:hypothetical protein